MNRGGTFKLKLTKSAITDDDYLTANRETQITDNQNSVIVDERSQVDPQDIQLIESVENFDRERIPERVAHATGPGAGE